MLICSQLMQVARRMLRQVFSRYVHSKAEQGVLEVERKFALTAQEAASLPDRLVELGFNYAGTASMTDTFLPGELPGEMMRVRHERLDDQPTQAILTFKKWVQTNSGKERQETERHIPSTVAALWIMVGRIIAGQPLYSFSKQRELYNGQLAGSDAVVSIDLVGGLGKYSGFYMEVEVLVPLAGDANKFKEAIFDLVGRLFDQPHQDLQQSYREMLIASRK